jgi:hypothetical protein
MDDGMFHVVGCPLPAVLVLAVLAVVCCLLLLVISHCA